MSFSNRSKYTKVVLPVFFTSDKIYFMSLHILLNTQTKKHTTKIKLFNGTKSLEMHFFTSPKKVRSCFEFLREIFMQLLRANLRSFIHRPGLHLTHIRILFPLRVKLCVNSNRQQIKRA